MEIELVNLCRHTVDIHQEDGSIVTFPPCGLEARVLDEGIMLPAPAITVKGTDLRVPTAAFRLPVVEGLPDPVNGRMLIVSRAVQRARPRRSDLVCPHDVVFADASSTRVVGCRNLRLTPICPD
jgi:hypothetical protein